MTDLPTTSLIATIAGAILSALFTYVPGLSGWYDHQAPQLKGLVMLGCMALASVVIYAARCWDFYPVAVTCDDAGIKTLVVAFIFAVVGAQGAHGATKRLTVGDLRSWRGVRD